MNLNNWSIKQKLVGSQEYKQQQMMKEQQQYMKNMEEIAAEIIQIFRDKRLEVRDIVTICDLIVKRVQAEVGKVHINYLLGDAMKQQEKEKKS
jgi:hypothetical protein